MSERNLPLVITNSYWYLAHQLEYAEDPIKFLVEKNIPFPKSLGIIADGNGRWAAQHGLPVTEGHRAGAKRIVELLRACYKLPIETVVVWAMSPDNAKKRSPMEIVGLMGIALEFLQMLMPEFQQYNARFIHLGRKEGLPDEVVRTFKAAEDTTANNTGKRVALAFNFDGKTEALDGMRSAISDAKSFRCNVEDDEALDKYRDHYKIGELDMLIRTSGEMRTSGIGRIADAAELFFPEVLMPDFTPRNLAGLLLENSSRDIRRGGRPMQTGKISTVSTQ